MDPERRKRRRASDGWNKHREEIEHLYLDEDLTLKEVMERMRAVHDFNKTEQAYKKRLSSWNISKNVPGSVIQEMVSIAERRRQESGKETRFYWHDSVVEHDKIQRTKKRLEKGKRVPKAPHALLKKYMRVRTPSIGSSQHSPVATADAESLDSEPNSLPVRSSMSNCNLLKTMSDDLPSDSTVAMRARIQRPAHNAAYSVVASSGNQILHQANSYDAVQALIFLLEDEQTPSLDVLATFETLRSLASTISPAADILSTGQVDQKSLSYAFSAQERLVGGYLFLFGNKHPHYLSQVLTLCYLAIYVQNWQDYIPVFKQAAPKVASLEFPGGSVGALLRLSLTYMDAKESCVEAFKLLDFAMDLSDEITRSWTPETRLGIISKAQEAMCLMAAEKHLVLAMQDLQDNKELWDLGDRASLLKKTLSQRRWQDTSGSVFSIVSEFGRTMFPLLYPEPSMQSLKLFFQFTKFLVDEFQAIDTATAMINNGVNSPRGRDILNSDENLRLQFSKWQEAMNSPRYERHSAGIISHICTAVIAEIDLKRTSSVSTDSSGPHRIPGASRSTIWLQPKNQNSEPQSETLKCQWQGCEMSFVTFQSYKHLRNHIQKNHTPSQPSPLTTSLIAPVTPQFPTSFFLPANSRDLPFFPNDASSQPLFTRDNPFAQRSGSPPPSNANNTTYVDHSILSPRALSRSASPSTVSISASPSDPSYTHSHPLSHPTDSPSRRPSGASINMTDHLRTVDRLPTAGSILSFSPTQPLHQNDHNAHQLQNQNQHPHDQHQLHNQHEQQQQQHLSTTSVPTSPFRMTSGFDQDWMEVAVAAADNAARRSSAPFLQRRSNNMPGSALTNSTLHDSTLSVNTTTAAATSGQDDDDDDDDEVVGHSGVGGGGGRGEGDAGDPDDDGVGAGITFTDPFGARPASVGQVHGQRQGQQQQRGLGEREAGVVWGTPSYTLRYDL